MLLWVPFFMVFMVLVTVTFWTPAVLNSVGFSLSAAALIIGLNNLGSVIASAMSGWLVHRGGAFRVLIPGFIIGGLCLAWFGQATTSVVTLGIASFLAGFFVGGTGTGLIAVAAGMYPTSIRSTGIGWAMGMGRVGQVLRAGPDRHPGRARLQGRRHFLRRRGAVLHRRAVSDLPVFLASGDGGRCGRPSSRRPNRSLAASTDTFAWVATAFHWAISFLMKAANSCGVLPTMRHGLRDDEALGSADR